MKNQKGDLPRCAQESRGFLHTETLEEVNTPIYIYKWLWMCVRDKY